MRCETCPAFLNVGGYEYPEYECSIQPEENIRAFADGSYGCLLHSETIRKRKDKLEAERDKSYEGIAEWYVLTHEIEEDPDVFFMAVNVLKEMAGYPPKSASCTYRRHGKIYIRPAMESICITRADLRYRAFKKLDFCHLVCCDNPDDIPYWKPQNMEEKLTYSISSDGLSWLSEKLMEKGEEIHFQGEKQTRK